MRLTLTGEAMTEVLTCRIITASELNGPLVLRHELGHSLIEVGEEYEGGMYYKHSLISVLD